jgi:hypothetical protein
LTIPLAAARSLGSVSSAVAERVSLMAGMENPSGRCDSRRGAADYVGTFQTGQACFRKIFPKLAGFSAPGRPYAMA